MWFYVKGTYKYAHFEKKDKKNFFILNKNIE